MARSGTDERGPYNRGVFRLGKLRLGYLAEVCSGADERMSNEHIAEACSGKVRFGKVRLLIKGVFRCRRKGGV